MKKTKRMIEFEIEAIENAVGLLQGQLEGGSIEEVFNEEDEEEYIKAVKRVIIKLNNMTYRLSKKI